MTFRPLALGLTLAAALALPTRSEAQQLLSAPLDLQVFRPAMDSKGFLTLNASQILAPLDFSFGLVTTWARRPINFETTVSGEPSTFRIENLITPSFQGAIGLFQQRQVGLELGVVVPIGVLNGRAYPDDPRTPGLTNDDIHYAFDAQGVGDIQIHPKLRLANASRNKWGISLIPTVVLPTGDKAKFLGEGQVIFQPTAAADVELGRPGVFRIGINGGMRIRSKEARFVDDPAHFVHTVGGMGMNRNTGFGVAVKNEVLAGVGVSWGVKPQVFDLVGEFYSFIPLSGTKIEGANSSSLKPGGEALAGLKLYLARNSFFEVGAGYGVLPTSYGTTRGRAFVGFIFEPSIGDRDGDGYKDDVDLCPDDPEDFDDFEDQDGCPEPDNDKDGILDYEDKCPNDPETKNGFQDEDGCPDSLTADRDGDGIPDDVDKCPDDPEDKDGFEDQDGCPDPDNDKDKILDVDDLCPNDPEDYDGFEDKDGCPDPDNDKDRILDVNDKCPNEPETYNGFQDEDGCPDQGKVIVRKGKLEILDKIYFETDKTDIKPISFPLLDAIAATIKGNPQLQLIEIQGHADERGSDQHNLELTDGRAHSVMNALVERGVNPGTLRAKGYGETKPICTQHTENCWSQNRRVEFIIMKRAEEPLLRGGEGQ
jgi:OOP family OmpA-OmpF porin